MRRVSDQLQGTREHKFPAMRVFGQHKTERRVALILRRIRRGFGSTAHEWFIRGDGSYGAGVSVAEVRVTTLK